MIEPTQSDLMRVDWIIEAAAQDRYAKVIEERHVLETQYWRLLLQSDRDRERADQWRAVATWASIALITVLFWLAWGQR